MSKKKPDNPSAPQQKGLIAIQPLGHVEEDVLKVVADSIQGLLRLPVDVRGPIPLPPETFMEARNQHNAMAIIKFLDTYHSDSSLKVLGITSKDITNPILTHVFGEAYMDGSAAVMSYSRLRAGPGSETVSREELLERVVKVAVHEIGHTFNIPHCHNGRCVMRASHGLHDLDEKLNYLCDYCELFLMESLAKALQETRKPAAQRESA